jgi:hypothetical protein
MISLKNKVKTGFNNTIMLHRKCLVSHYRENSFTGCQSHKTFFFVSNGGFK